MSKHTPEPWESLNGSILSGDKRFSIAHFILYSGTHDNETNAARAVACVNACAGINPEGVPDAVAALKRAIDWAEEYASIGTRNHPSFFSEARAALAKLEATNDH